MKVIIVITAVEWFRRLTARALARAGHSRLCEHAQRPRAAMLLQVKEVEKYAADHGVAGPIELDVSSQNLCKAAIQEFVAKERSLDVVIQQRRTHVFGPAEASRQNNSRAV